MGASLKVLTRSFPLAEVFTISRGGRTEAHVVEVILTDGAHTGHGECVPYPRYGESVESVMAALEVMQARVADGLDREGLRKAMPAGAARNALDCAMWDLESKKAGRPAWQLAGLGAPGVLETAYTISLAEPSVMGAKAAANAHRPLLKIKLGTDDDLGRIEAVRRGAPHSHIIVDANEGWTVDDYLKLAPAFVRLGVKMVEQPFPAKADDALLDIERVLPVCADESCHDTASVPKMAGKYDFINIKLDKTGGLTEALDLRRAAEAAGLRIMVGCMVGTSLAMAPAMLVAQGAEFVDLDAPLLLAQDRENGLVYNGSLIEPAPAELWG